MQRIDSSGSNQDYPPDRTARTSAPMDNVSARLQQGAPEPGRAFTAQQGARSSPERLEQAVAATQVFTRATDAQSRRQCMRRLITDMRQEQGQADNFPGAKLLELLNKELAPEAQLDWTAFMNPTRSDGILEERLATIISKHGAELLEEAVCSARPEQIQALLALGVPPNTPIDYHPTIGFDCETVTPLQLLLEGADRAEAIPALQTLLAAGAEVNPSGPGLLPTVFLCMSITTQVFRVLMRAGLDVQAAYPDGQNRDGVYSVLHELEEEVPGISAVLFEELALRNSPGTVEHLQAVKEGNLQRAERALDMGADIDGYDRGGQSALALAAASGNTNLARLLLHRGAKINTYDQLFRTPLHVAQNAEIAALLLDQGAEIDHANHKGRTALHEQAAAGRVDVVETLLQHGANIEATDKKGQTPLAQAILHGQHEMVYELMAREANPFPDGGQQNLLYVAAHEGKTSCVRALLDCEVDPQLRSAAYKGLLPIHAAANEEIAALLLRAEPALATALGPNGVTPLHTCANPNIARLLLDQGASPHARTSDGRTPLHFVAQDPRKLEVVRLLLQRGAEPNIQDGLNRTPLHYAAYGNGPQNVALLLEAGANPNAVDDRGNAPLAMTGRPATALPLIRAGANLDILLQPINNAQGRFRLNSMTARHPELASELLSAIVSQNPTPQLASVAARIATIQRRVRFAHLLEPASITLDPSRTLVLRSGEQSPPVKLTGNFHQEWMHLLCQEMKALEAGGEGIPSVLSPDACQQIHDAFSHATTLSSEQEINEALGRFAQGRPVIILSGYLKHATITGMCRLPGQADALYFRADLGGAEGFQIHRMPLPTDQAAFVRHLASIRDLFREAGSYLNQEGTAGGKRFWDDQAGRTLSLYDDPLTELLNQANPLLQQVIGNCSWASSTGGLLGLMLTQAVLRCNEKGLALEDEIERSVVGFEELVFKIQLDCMEDVLRAAMDPNNPYAPDHELIMDGFRQLIHHRDSTVESAIGLESGLNGRLEKLCEVYSELVSDNVSTDLLVEWTGVQRAVFDTPRSDVAALYTAIRAFKKDRDPRSVRVLSHLMRQHLPLITRLRVDPSAPEVIEGLSRMAGAIRHYAPSESAANIATKIDHIVARSLEEQARDIDYGKRPESPHEFEAMQVVDPMEDVGGYAPGTNAYEERKGPGKRGRAELDSVADSDTQGGAERKREARE